MIGDDGKLIRPGAFLPAAERFGLMAQIDRWVIERVFRFYPHVFMQNPDLVLNINLSAASIADESLADYILQMFETSVIRPQQACFEIAETAFSQHPANAGRLISRLQDSGCGFALDDFGSGLASFSALKDLHVDFVKIDGDLIRDICSDAVDCKMVESINSMAHLLDIKTVAESVDGEDELEKLKSIGIDYAQGYYLGQLLRIDDIGTLDAESRLIENQVD